VQLIDRHDRDCAVLAERFAVPHLEVPFGGVPGSPFEVVKVVDRPLWREVALWWPEGRVLVCGDALGTLPYFLAPGERLGVHPLLRVTPPRALGALDAEHVLVGHGKGVHGDETGQALASAVANARRGLPAALLRGLRGLVRR
jgi:glyoxylase-like metal-dependent hydrolase (beta-lactamase superfamily II)